jgi:ribosomal protein L37E
MNGLQIIGPSPRPDVAYHAARVRAAHEQRVHQARAELRAVHVHTRADTGIACPDCGSGIYDYSYGYCPACGYERSTRNNGNPVQLDQRNTHTHPCPTCQAPTTSAGPCSWCRHWQRVESQAMARYGTVSEREVSRLGRSHVV